MNSSDEILALFPAGSGWLTESFYNFNNQWGRLQQFRTIVEMGLPDAEASYASQILDFLQDMRPGNELEDLLADGQAFFKEGKDKEMAINGARQAVEHSINVAESLALLWGHSLFENCLQKYLEIIVLISPESFHDVIIQQKVSLAEVKETGFESVLRQRASKRVASLGRESLIDKSDELHRIFGSVISKFTNKRFKFKKETLARIDKRRHDVAHGQNLLLPKALIELDLEFLYQAYGYFLFLINEKFNLKISTHEKVTSALIMRDNNLRN